MFPKADADGIMGSIVHLRGHKAKPNHEPACCQRSYTRPKTVSNWLLLNLLIITVHNSTFCLHIRNTFKC